VIDSALNLFMCEFSARCCIVRYSSLHCLSLEYCNFARLVCRCHNGTRSRQGTCLGGPEKCTICDSRQRHDGPGLDARYSQLQVSRSRLSKSRAGSLAVRVTKLDDSHCILHSHSQLSSEYSILVSLVLLSHSWIPIIQIESFLFVSPPRMTICTRSSTVNPRNVKKFWTT
jgi:hypothetical protein